MAKRMLIDASHPEETRVVVLSGNRLEDFDYETASKKQLKGNIYLAKITRVEPSLQAAFVDYGGNRHGFLPFSEIHPDYYRIPIADRKALLAEEAKLKNDSVEDEADADEAPEADAAADSDTETGAEAPDGSAEPAEADDGEVADVEEVAGEASVDTVGGDEVDDAARRRARRMRRYKIQEVIKRRQVILVQVTKEERGNKGAALTSYLSLAGRYCVLMPNTGKGGGISRKISNPSDRRRLKKVVENLDIPEGVAVIVRTAGSERTKVEIKRDYEYLLRLWGEIRDATLASIAPNLIYEEANLIKRAMRDLYQSDMDEILVDGEEGQKHAKAFMKSLMPSHARKVKLYKDPTVPLFYRHQVESQIDSMHNATVQLKSGGYIVINMTEALVAIDVNSGKATRERHIEETAYKTNLEAAEEIARQQRLRDLAGLIVIDFIDMEESRHNRAVERKLKEAMRLDRARIQLGRISPFGLLEMSRQRLRPSLFESSTVVCPNCNASGYVRTTESMALHVLRGLEEEGIRRGSGDVLVTAPSAAALHLLNRMRDRIVEIEHRYGFQVRVEVDESLIAPNYNLERLSLGPRSGAEEEEEHRERSEGEGEGDRSERKRTRGRRRRRRGEEPAEAAPAEPAEAEAETDAKEEEGEAITEDRADAPEQDGEDKPKRRRRRGKRGGRRRARRRGEEDSDTAAEESAADSPEPESTEEAAPEAAPEAASEAASEAAPGAAGVDDPLEAPSNVVTAEAAESEAPKPRRRRAPRRKKAAAPAPEVTAEKETPKDTGESEAETEAKPKRKRSAAKRAPRKNAAARKKATPHAEPAAEPVPEAPDMPAPGTAPGTAPVAASVPTPEDPVPANGEDPADLPAAPVPDAETAAPRRRGWWQKFS